MADKYEILHAMKATLSEKLGDNLKDIILFGSRAYGGAHAYSDYDFLIILKEKPDWKLQRKISEYCYGIDLLYDVFTDVHILAEEELTQLRGRQPIFQTAIKKGIYA
jgi:predicted nucleotidyltransferase